MKKSCLVILFIFLAGFIFPQEILLPYFESGDVILRCTDYVAKYDETHEQSEWVAYKLTADEVVAETDRTNDFREDPRVLTGTATLEDYKNSGYSRGHLAPAEDMEGSAIKMSESFLMINMSPQNQSFNSGIWKKLENRVQKIAAANEEIFIVVGPVLTDGPYETIGENEVAVPKQFYKVILDYNPPELKAIGFIIPHEQRTVSLGVFAYTIDEVEEITGINFFHALEDRLEESLESTIDLALWPELQ